MYSFNITKYGSQINNEKLYLSELYTLFFFVIIKKSTQARFVVCKHLLLFQTKK